MTSCAICGYSVDIAKFLEAGHDFPFREIGVPIQLTSIPEYHFVAHQFLDPCDGRVAPHSLVFRSQNGSRFKNRSTVSTSSPPGARASLAAANVEAMSGSERCSMVEIQNTAENCPTRSASGRVAR